MSAKSSFRDASERLELTFSAVAVIAKGCPLDAAFEILSAMQVDEERHGAAVYGVLDKLAAVSDGPIKWSHGRGASGFARVPSAVFPHVWSSAHQAALEISRLALDHFYWPLAGITNPKEQQSTFKRLLSKSRRKVMALTMEEIADLQERMRRERAKILRRIKAVWLGNGVVRINDEPVALELQEATVLQALIQLGGAATRPDLEKKAGVKDVAETMKKLKTRFPDYITLPGRRGKGGYATTIKDGTKANR
jgi:hypothetical protein